MNRTAAALFALSLTLLGCRAQSPTDAAAQGSGQPASAAAAAASTAAPVATATPSPAAIQRNGAVGGSGRSVKERNASYEFDYSYPAAAGAIPGVKAWLDADLAKQKAELADDARQGQADARESGFGFNPYGYSGAWSVVTELPGWLSLSGSMWSFSGGAHGNPWSQALLWDKGANVRRAPLDLFTSPQALSRAIRAPFCDQLDKERAKRRETKIDRNSGDPFDACIDPVKSVIILGSSNRQQFNRIGVLVDPYEAGPYVEGTYDISIPVTAAVIAAVKPQYRAAFAPGR